MKHFVQVADLQNVLRCLQASVTLHACAQVLHTADTDLLINITSQPCHALTGSAWIVSQACYSIIKGCVACRLDAPGHSEGSTKPEAHRGRHHRSGLVQHIHPV